MLLGMSGRLALLTRMKAYHEDKEELFGTCTVGVVNHQATREAHLQRQKPKQKCTAGVVNHRATRKAHLQQQKPKQKKRDEC
eukprot:1161841-Pelagomonas_calceolata.AAC.7